MVRTLSRPADSLGAFFPRTHCGCNPQVDTSNLVTHSGLPVRLCELHLQIVVSLQEPVQPRISNGPAIPVFCRIRKPLISNKRVQRCVYWAW